MYNYTTTNFAHLATLGQRLGGQLIDALVQVVLLAVLIFSASFILPSSIAWLSLPLGLLLGALYILFADGLGEGQSLGKRVAKTRVVDSQTGEPCTYRQSFIRNIFNALGIIDWACIFGEKRQRLGDMVAGTVVIEA